MPCASCPISCRSSSLLSKVAAFGLLLCLAVAPAAAQGTAWKVETATRLDKLQDVSLTYDGDRVVVLRAGGRRFGLTLPHGMVLITPLRHRPHPDYGKTIPDGRIAVGKGIIGSTRLVEPTDRYTHGALGDKVEGGALAVRFRGGGESIYRLPADSVFEDLAPRIITLDGHEAVLTVRSYLKSGAALAVYGVVKGTVVPLAESRPLGQPFRWLNPIGAADFDGDGKTEIAAVVTPHLGGTLTLYRRAGKVLEPVASLPGFADHILGSTAITMHAIADIDGDGLDDIIVPTQDRRHLDAVSFAGGRLHVVRSAALDAPIITSIVMADLHRTGRPDIYFGLANNEVMMIRR